MNGNVEEWCLDRLEEPYPAESQIDPRGPATGGIRALRGGSWYHAANDYGSAGREGAGPDYHNIDLGFRVVCALTIPEEPLSKSVESSIGLHFVDIKPGSFKMGSETGNSDEKPLHTVVISRAFLMAETEVTQKQFSAVMGYNPSFFRGESLPVECVSWTEAMEFCDRLRREGTFPDGFEFRLPTEAEWEYCARAGSSTAYCFGDTTGSLKAYGWYDANAGGKTHPVRSKRPNAWGLYDMYGNVSEWCLDWCSDRYSYDTSTDPLGLAGGLFKSARGGSCLSSAFPCRSASRGKIVPGGGGRGNGLRVVCAESVKSRIKKDQSYGYEQLSAGDRRFCDSLTPVKREEYLKTREEDRPLFAVSNGRSSIGLSLVSIERGSFVMGSEKGSETERPAHGVTIARSFLMGATEVTQEQYTAVMGSNPSKFQSGNLPVEQISWTDAVEFCRKLTAREQALGVLPDGLAYRLPTEAEWEYCARAGSMTEYCFGDDPRALGDCAWFAENSKEKARPVGTKRPNAWGLYDMNGNVSEWCQDWYAEAYLPGIGTDPLGPENGQAKVVRGGSSVDGSVDCRSSSRSGSPVDRRDASLGFRVVCATNWIGLLANYDHTTYLSLSVDQQEMCAELPGELRIRYLALAIDDRWFCNDLAPEMREKYLRMERPDERAVFELVNGRSSIGLSLVPIAPGSFFMGLDNRGLSGEPGNEVIISSPFLISATEVTQKQYEALMSVNPSGVRGKDLPVNRVTWNEATEFCRRLTEEEIASGRLAEGFEYRLPSEAEWEYCARAGSRSKYSFGDDVEQLGDYSWFGANSDGGIHPVGKKKPNAWGLYDMHGNAREWCLDWFGQYPVELRPPESDPRVDPQGPLTGVCKVLRGGGFSSDSDSCGTTFRSGRVPGSRRDFIGFRVVCSAIPVYMPLSSRTRSSIGLSLVSISPGKFVMGNDKEYSGEAPAHRVEITRSFLMSATEVTQKQYEAVMGVNPSSFRGSDLPVETVSWNDAADFCRKLTELELKHGNLPKGYGYRLPTEAEWEYCCRAGSTTDYCFGDDEKLLGDYAWFGEAGYITHPVGTKMPNAWGLYDMHGNVCEWVWDWYSDYTVGTQVDPRGHLKGGWKVLRDEGLGADPRQYRSSGRAMAGPDNKGYWFGFRVVCAALTPEEILLAEVKSSIGISLVPVARDEFAMGSENGDPDEKETHTVEITRSFLMGSTEITQKQYADVMGANPSHVQGDDLPVDQVSWNEATEFCRKLTERERAAGLLPDGLEYRLPTEAEWEFCARAESGREYFFSTKEANNIYLLGDYAWFNGNAEGTCHPVGTRKPNAWGLYDMYGNVWEWCLDWYAEKYPYGAGTNPRGPEHGQDRVLRGGSWNDLPEDCRSAIRNRLRPDDTLDICGFRVVCACVR